MTTTTTTVQRVWDALIRTDNPAPPHEALDMVIEEVGGDRGDAMRILYQVAGEWIGEYGVQGGIHLNWRASLPEDKEVGGTYTGRSCVLVTRGLLEAACVEVEWIEPDERDRGYYPFGNWKYEFDRVITVLRALEAL